MTARPYQLLPPLDEEQRHLLFQSIKKSGVLEPVVFDEDGEILDGHHRVEIAEELDIDYPRRVVADLDEAGKRRYAITTNVARRQLSPTVRSSLVAQLRMQGLSVRKIAEETGLPKSTVSLDLKQLSNLGQLDQPERITGADGRERPSTRPAQSPGPVDPTTSPADPGATPAPAPPSPSAPAREPDPTPAGLDLVAEIVHVLAQADTKGLTVAQIGEAWPDGVAHNDLTAALGTLFDAGRIVEVGVTDMGASRWALAAKSPEPVAAPSLRLDPTADDKRAAVQRDARGLLLRAVEILAPDHDRPGYAETWARQLGPYDAELSDLIRRAAEAIATLDDLIEGCGQ